MVFPLNDFASLLGDAATPGEAVTALLVTREGRIERCSAVAERLFQRTRDELEGEDVALLFGSGEEFDHFRHIERSRTGKGCGSVNWVLNVNGKPLRCRITTHTLEMPLGPKETLWFFEDVTQTIDQAERLVKTVRELDALMSNAPVGIIFTSQRRLTRANPRFCEMFGYSEEDVMALRGRDLFPSEEVYQALGRHAQPLLSAGKAMEYECPMRRADGSTFWARLLAFVLNPEDTEQGTIWILSDQTVLREHQARIEAALRENQVILDSAVVGIVYLRNRTVVRCNPLAEKIFGYAPGEMLGQSTRIWYASEDDYLGVGRNIYPAISAGENYVQEYRLVRKDGSRFWCRLSGQVLDRDNPVAGASIWIVEDTTARHAAEEALVRASELMRGVFDAARVSIIVTDPVGVIQMLNPTALQWLGYSADELIGRVTPQQLHDPEEVAAYTAELSRKLGRMIEPGFDTFVLRALVEGADEREWHYVRKDGSRFPVHLTTSVLRDGSGGISGYIGVGVDLSDRQRAEEALRTYSLKLEQEVRDRTNELHEMVLKLQREIAERQAIEAQMRAMAHYDALTGLANRNLLGERLRHALALAKRDAGSTLALMFIDLDRFKRINDSLGHDVGDLLLQAAARRMEETVREGDTLARFGGDEFVLLCPGFKVPPDATALAERLLSVFQSDFQIGGHALQTSPSVGIAIYPVDGEDGETLLRHADMAMYQAKLAGKNTYRYFSQQTDGSVPTAPSAGV